MNPKQSRSSKIEYILEPPDGGWGYMIIFGMVLVFSFNGIYFFNFGVIFADILEQTGYDISSSVMVSSTFGVCSTITGLLTNKVITNYPLRAVGYVGCCIYCTGSLSSIFSQNILQLMFTFGVLQGVGYGIISPVVYTTFICYMTKKRNTLNSACLTCTSAISLMCPTLIQYSEMFYGSRGTKAIIAAINFNLFFAISLMQPVQWHMVKRIKDVETNRSENDNDNPEPMDGPAVVTPLPTPRASQISVLRKSVIVRKSLDVAKLNQKLANHNVNNIDEKKHTIISKFIADLDLSLLKDWVFLNILIGLSVAVVVDSYFSYLVPQLLYKNGFSSQDVTVVLTVSSIGDFLTRFSQIFLHTIFIIDCRYQFLFGMITTTIVRFLLTLSSSLDVMKYSLMSMGFFRSCLLVAAPLVVGQHFTVDKFPAAYGLYMIFMSISYLIMGPLVVATFKYFPHDQIIIGLFATISLATILGWFVEIFWRKCQKNN